MTTTYRIDYSAVFNALRSLPTKHPVYQTWSNWYGWNVLEWWDSVKHNTGPEWDEFRLKVIEEVHFK